MEDDLYMNDEAVMKVIESMRTQVAHVGLKSIDLMSLPDLKEGDLQLMLKANLFLTAFVMLLGDVQNTNNMTTAKTLVAMWANKPLNDLVRVAYADEISSLKESIDDEIQLIENWANKDD